MIALGVILLAIGIVTGISTLWRSTSSSGSWGRSDTPSADASITGSKQVSRGSAAGAVGLLPATREAGQTMAKHQSKSSQPSHGEGPGRHKGTKQHGWSPDVDETRQQDNPSAHRSFHPDQHAPAKGSGREVSKEEAGDPHGKPVKSRGAAARTRARPKGTRRVCTTPAPGVAPSAPAEPKTHPPPPASTPRTRQARAAGLNIATRSAVHVLRRPLLPGRGV